VKTSAAQRRSSCSDSSTHRRTPSSRASPRNSSSYAMRHRRHRPANPGPQIAHHTNHLRPSAHYGRLMHHCGGTDRYWTPRAKYVIPLVRSFA
jgi:hypothetical protein